jgi:type IV pilus assembly protein PilA
MIRLLSHRATSLSGRRRSASRQPNGFTLMELLIVMAIIAILMLIAIPTVSSLTKKANDTSAIQSIHAIVQAQTMYSSNYPSTGFACSLTVLGGDPKSGAPSAASAQILPPDLVAGVKSGYIFSISNCTKKNLNGNDLVTGYQVTAVPITVGQTGDKGYCADQTNAIKFDPAGGTNCVQNMGQ